ncbi:MAG: zinc ABC transporter substrate-binding protein [Magnetococcales bacterium]|nr:zinc ABC transporter substrate-binding protein [Magnetococcales bacterium]
MAPPPSRLVLPLLLFALFVSAPMGGAAPTSPRVVASILPVHALAAEVMAGVGKPDLLVPGNTSPHSFTLRPSDARKLREADIVFWVGEGLENFLQSPLEKLATGARILALSQAEGVSLRPASRDIATSIAAPPFSGSGTVHQHGTGAETGERGASDGGDWHIWLDPENARAMAAAMAGALIQSDPVNAASYRQNLTRLTTRLGELTREIEATLAPVREIPFAVFHDAYRHFGQRFGLRPVAIVTHAPGRPLGARRLGEVRAALTAGRAVCLFREPPFPPSLAETILKGTTVRLGLLDPEGGTLEPGEGAYFALIRGMAEALRHCLRSG